MCWVGKNIKHHFWSTRLQLRLYFTTRKLPLVLLWVSFCALGTRICPGSYSKRKSSGYFRNEAKVVITHVLSVHLKNLSVSDIRGNVTVN